VRIVKLLAGSAAAKAGLAQGDVITAINGRAITTPEALDQEISASVPGCQVIVAYKFRGTTWRLQTNVELAGGP
jgi:serine protease Do